MRVRKKKCKFVRIKRLNTNLYQEMSNITKKIALFALTALIMSGCKNAPTSAEKTPISKPEIRIEGGRLTPEGLWAMGRIGSVKADVETGSIAYQVSYYSVAENRSTSWIRLCFEEENSLKVYDEFVGSDPEWFADGMLAYLRGGKLYIRQHGSDIELGGEDVEGFLFSPMRDRVVLVKQVKTVPTTEDKHADLPLASGRVVDDLMYKHWDEWTETAPHPFIHQVTYSYEKNVRLKSATMGEGVDILAGTAYESPMKPFGGVEQLAWSRDGKTLAYTCRKKTGLDYAVSTNSDIYLYDVTGDQNTNHRNITAPNGGYDINPSYSPDGKYIAWLSMERDGYESDWNRLFIMDLETGCKKQLCAGFDTSVDEYTWAGDGEIVFSACWHGEVGLYQVNIHTDEYRQIAGGQYDYVPGNTIDGEHYCLRHSMCEANEIYKILESGEIIQLTHENDNIYSQIERSTVVPRWQTTTDGKQMLTWIIYPPHFDPSKKYPTLLYCEGGPQSPVSQFWSFRWNFMMMTAGDYIVVAPNRRGLGGFGMEWNEQISGDYGGQCMKDYFTAIDEFCSEPYVDRDHLGCVGASFGGYSVYWIAGHHNKRFKAFIAHDGIFNMEMQYLETEEKWFANWDMGGAYWDKSNATAQRTFANSPHKFVGQWDTPILCIHGEKDYRILANQAMAAFDAAKMQGIPARLLIFPDENHWVLKPQNGILWQREFRAWLDQWLKD